ncbi:MAG: hypothetical protein BIFFINMI_03150 [Phycisphaerae bacterium]|nr:hypothetical protein [Phycisphaerae bacterium]
MKRIAYTLAAALAGLLLIAGSPLRADDAPQAPTTQPDATGQTPRLPAGHPAIGDTSRLPAGHPAIGGQGKLPAGHPAIGGTGGLPAGHPALGPNGKMPAGHPQVEGVTPEQAPPFPTSQPETVRGVLMITATQGTAGAAVPAGDDVLVDLMYGGFSIRQLRGKLDSGGRLILSDVPVGVKVMPMVTVRHDNHDFRQTGPLMSPEDPDRAVRIAVYQTTETAPAWKVSMHHLILTRMPDGKSYRVREMLVVENPTDKVWIGPMDAKGQRVTMHIPLPVNTDGRAQVDATVAVPPGSSQHTIAYAIPVKDGKAVVELVAPAPTDRLVVVKADDDGAKVSLAGLEVGQQMQIDKGRTMTFYQAESLKAGQKVSLTLELSDKPAPPKTNEAWRTGGGK